MDESTSLHQALNLIQKTKESILELESLLHASPNENFRERLVAHMEENTDEGFRLKAQALLAIYEKVFGVKDVMDESFEDQD